MLLIKRNSREFKDIEKIFKEYRRMPTRKRLILLYALKPSEPISKRVLINSLPKDSDVLYEMHYNSILAYFADSGEKLYRENRQPLYYFKSSPETDWLELPFELKGKLKQRVFPLKIVKQ
jgi:hypothetical protein